MNYDKLKNELTEAEERRKNRPTTLEENQIRATTKAIINYLVFQYLNEIPKERVVNVCLNLGINKEQIEETFEKLLKSSEIYFKHKNIISRLQ